MKETTDIMAMLLKTEMHKIVDGLGNYGSYTGFDDWVKDIVTEYEVKKEGILTIANTDKLKGKYLWYFGGSQWSVKYLTEWPDYYLVITEIENGYARWEFELHRKPNQFHNYDLCYGDRLMATFTYDELRTPDALIRELCNILDLQTKNQIP